MAIDIDLARKRLETVRAEIEANSRSAASARDTVELDQQAVGRISRVDALQRQGLAKSTEAARRRDLLCIEMAFRHINDGEYGFCADCGEEIADKQLAIDPMAERCITCASAARG